MTAFIILVTTAIVAVIIFTSMSIKINRTIKKTLQTISIILLVYLFFDALFHLDFAATLNNLFFSRQKSDIDDVQNMEILKLKAKEAIDQSHYSQKSYATKSLTNLYIFMVLVIIQTVLIKAKAENSE